MTNKKSLKTLRKAHKLTLMQLAEKAGIHWITLWRAEKRNGWPHNPSVRKSLEIALGVAP